MRGTRLEPRVRDLVIRHARLATLTGPRGARTAESASDVTLRPAHTVVVEGGRIAWVGPDEEWDGGDGGAPASAGQGAADKGDGAAGEGDAASRKEDAAAGTGDAPDGPRVVDAQGSLVTPGFVDPHTHLSYAGDRAFELGMKLAGRSYLDILEAGGGIAHTVGKTREASRGGLVEQALPRLRRMLANGTTSLEAKSGYGLETDAECKQLAAGADLAEATGVTMVHTFLGAHAVPTEFQGRTDAYVDEVIEEMLPAVAKQGIATFCDVFVEKGVFTVAQGRRILEAGKRHGLRPRLHADEIVRTGGAELAAEVAAASADHLLRASDEGIAAMAEAGTIATLLPTVPLTLFQPEWPAAGRFLDAGVPVALATDHNPNNPVTDMNLVAQLSCFLLGLTPAQALTAATWNAACSLGIQDQVGSIEAGKRADLLVHDVPDLDHWVYEPGRRTVRTVILGGQVV